MTVGILYLGGFRESADPLLHLVPTARVSSVSDLYRKALQGADRWILRTKRLTIGEYCAIADAVAGCGAELVNSELSYAIVSSLRPVQKALSSFSPPMVAGRRELSTADFLSVVADRGLQAPLFVRSEVESAAKYAGFEACVVSELSANGLEAPLRALQEHVAGFNEVAFKELWRVKKLGQSDYDLEYRTFGYRGKLVSVDQPRADVLPRLWPWHFDFLNSAYEALAELGADGLHVLDLAIRDPDRKPYIVEWKDFSSSSLKNPAKSLQSAIDGIARSGN